MKRLLAAAIFTISIASTWAVADQAQPLSLAQLQKILKFVDTNGGKNEFPPPTAQNLGISNDPNQTLPVTVVVTDNHQVYFCRSELNPADYIIWSRTPDNNSSYMFLTHSDLKLIRALYLRNEAFPQVADVASTQVQAVYKDALATLAKDVDSGSSH